MIKFTDEQLNLKSSLENFLQREVPPEKDHAYDQSSEFPYELYQKIADMGVLGLIIPEEYGGSGMGPVTAALVHETLAYNAVVAHAVVMPTSICSQLLIHGGSEKQKQEYLPKIAAGEMRVAFGLSEPQSGSDAAGLKTRASKTDDGWTINGQKMWTSGADVASRLLVGARTNPDAEKHVGISVFIVDPETPGVAISRIDNLGPKCTGTCQVFYDDVKVGPGDLVGEEEGVGRGWEYLSAGLALERIQLAGSCLGIAQRVLHEAIDFVKNREAFGQQVSKFQALQHMAADLATKIEAARALTYATAAAMEDGQDASLQVIHAKVFVTELAREACITSLQIMGGHGYAMEYNIQRYLRRALIQPIGGGSTQVLRNVIARNLGM